MGGKPKLKDRILHNEKWYIYKYVVALRHVEYYMNCAGGGKRNPLFLIWWYRYKLLRLPARRLTGTDYQHFTANLGNIWETL